MAIGKQFDEEMGYAASRELPPAVAQYMKATGKSEEQVAKEIINEDPEWLDWTTHTKHPGNSTPEDNGWTDLKKLGLGIGRSVSDSWMNHRNNTDPMWRVGLVNAIFGDPSMLGQYYQMQNQNEQNRLNREAQMAYNSQIKAVEDASAEALKSSQNEKTWNDVVARVSDAGKKLSKVESITLKNAWDSLNDSQKATHKNEAIALGIVSDDQEAAAESENSDAPRYGTDLQQTITKDDVDIERQRINAMPNGPEKQQAMKDLNAEILSAGKEVQGTLGATYSAKEIKDANPSKPKTYKVGDKVSASEIDSKKYTYKKVGPTQYEVTGVRK